MFIDEARINIKAGDGGNGAVAFRREAHVPRGGPSGGNGGRGGDVYLEADTQANTLIAFTYKMHFKADSGSHGSNKNQTGASGPDLVIKVPVGTVAYEVETGLLMADLTEPGQRALVAQGGRGGRGNWTFRTPTNQAPRIAENGEPGEERTPPPGAEAAGRRGHRRHPERGQVHLAEPGERGAAEDRRLPLHDPRAEPRRGGDRQPRHGVGRHSRLDRGRTRGRRPRDPVPAPYRADTAGRPPARRHERRPAGGLCGDQRGTRAVQPAAGRKAAGGRRQQDGPHRGAGTLARAGGRAEEAGGARTVGDFRGFGRGGAGAPAPGGRPACRAAPGAAAGRGPAARPANAAKRT